jgi:hypothetical protein
VVVAPTVKTPVIPRLLEVALANVLEPVTVKFVIVVVASAEDPVA